MDEFELLALLYGLRAQPVRVCRIFADYAARIGASTTLVQLSRDTASKIEIKHRDENLKLYRMAEAILAYGTLYSDAPNVLIAIHEVKGADGKREIYKAVIKATMAGHEIYLTSVHRIDERSLRAIQRRCEAYRKGRGVR